MLKSTLLHPNILAALARGGHSAKVLISDGNYPHWSKRGPNAEVVFLNLSPGLVTVPDVLKALVTAINIEKAEVMQPMTTGPNAMSGDPPIWGEFRQIIHEAKFDLDLDKVERFKFYEVAGAPDVVLTIATGEQRIYANLLLTIGVVKPPTA